MKYIFSIAALCLLGTAEAVKIKAETTSEVESQGAGCCGSTPSCLLFQEPNINANCAQCKSAACCSTESDFAKGPDQTVVSYAGVQSVESSCFWQIIQDCPYAMILYNYYIKVVKHNEEYLEWYQGKLNVKISILNYLKNYVKAHNTAAYKYLLDRLLEISHLKDTGVIGNFDLEGSLETLAE